MNYSEYEEATGFFTGAVVEVASEAALTAQMRPGLNYAQGVYLRDLFKVDLATRTVIEPSAEAIARYQSRPSFPADWDRATMQWVDLRTLGNHKAERAAAIKSEGLAKIRETMPGLADLATVLALRELYLSIAPAARQPTAALLKVMAIYQAASTALDQVKAAGSKEAVESVAVNWPA